MRFTLTKSEKRAYRQSKLDALVTGKITCRYHALQIYLKHKNSHDPINTTVSMDYEDMDFVKFWSKKTSEKVDLKTKDKEKRERSLSMSPREAFIRLYGVQRKLNEYARLYKQKIFFLATSKYAVGFEKYLMKNPNDPSEEWFIHRIYGLHDKNNRVHTLDTYKYGATVYFNIKAVEYINTASIQIQDRVGVLFTKGYETATKEQFDKMMEEHKQVRRECLRRD